MRMYRATKLDPRRGNAITQIVASLSRRAELAAVPATAIAIEAAQPNLDADLVAQLAPRGVVLGVLDLSTEEIEDTNDVAARIRAALRHIAPEALTVSPDCGMKFLSRPVARAKLEAMVAGAAIVRRELTG